MFTANHFIWMGICAALIGILLFLSLKCKFSKKTAILIMVGFSIASELTKMFTRIHPVLDEAGEVVGGVLSPSALPLHLCSIFIFVFFYLAIQKNEEREKKIISFFVPIGLIGSFCAILMATSGVDFRDTSAYQSFLYHAAMMYLALYFIITKQVDLGLRAYIRNLVVFTCLVLVMIWVNSALKVYDTNFFFVVKPPAKNLPFLNMKKGWYVYFLRLVFCGFVGETLMSLPYIIKELRQKKAMKKVEEEAGPETDSDAISAE